MAPQHGDRKQDGNAVAEPVMRWFTWEEVAQRTGRGPALQERWVVIDRKVYDISHFYRRHPGGALLISSHAGQDVTVRGSKMGKRCSPPACAVCWLPGQHHAVRAWGVIVLGIHGGWGTATGSVVLLVCASFPAYAMETGKS